MRHDRDVAPLKAIQSSSCHSIIEAGQRIKQTIQLAMSVIICLVQVSRFFTTRKDLFLNKPQYNSQTFLQPLAW